MKNLRIACLLALTLLGTTVVVAEDNEGAKKDLASLQGEWSMVSANGGGQSLPGEMLKNSKRVCKGAEVTVTVAGQLLMKANVTLDPGQKPKRIDYHVTGGSNAGKTQLGIYELDGDTVKF